MAETRHDAAKPHRTGQDRASTAGPEITAPDITGAFAAGIGLSRIDHVGVAVADLDEAGSRVNFIHPKDAGGVLIELVEPAPPS